MSKGKIEISEKIYASQDKIFEFITNPKNIPLILPGLVENSNIPELPLKKRDQFNYKYSMFGIVFNGIWKVLEIERSSSYHAETTGGVNSTWKMNFNQEDEKVTLYKLEVEYEIPAPFFQGLQSKILEKINKKEAETMIHNLKAVLEKVD